MRRFSIDIIHYTIGASGDIFSPLGTCMSSVVLYSLLRGWRKSSILLKNKELSDVYHTKEGVNDGHFIKQGCHHDTFTLVLVNNASGAQFSLKW